MHVAVIRNVFLSISVNRELRKLKSVFCAATTKYYDLDRKMFVAQGYKWYESTLTHTFMILLRPDNQYNNYLEQITKFGFFLKKRKYPP